MPVRRLRAKSGESVARLLETLVAERAEDRGGQRMTLADEAAQQTGPIIVGCSGSHVMGIAEPASDLARRRATSETLVGQR